VLRFPDTELGPDQTRYVGLLSTWLPAGTPRFWPRAGLWHCDVTRGAACRQSIPAHASHT